MKRSLISLAVFICFAELFFISFRVEKRIYRKGYHVVWNHKKTKEPKKTEVAQVSNPEGKPDLIAANENSLEVIPIKKAPLLVLGADTCGDKLLLQTADELSVKILEIDESFIKYKRCDNLNGPTYSISKNRVALITYANGTKEVIQQQAPTYKPQGKPSVSQDAPPKTNPLGLVSLLGHIVLSIASQAVIYGTGAPGTVAFLLLAWIAIIVMAYTAIFQFKNEPGKYKGRWMPVVVIIFNAVGFLLFGLIFTGYGGATGLAMIFLLIGLLMFGILIAGLLPKPQPTKN